MNATASRITETRAVATLRCVRRWPTGLDRKFKPTRGTWVPFEIRASEEAEPLLLPLVACPRCGERGGFFSLPLDEETRAILRARNPSVEPPAIVAVGEKGEIDELRCPACRWYGGATLAGWNEWQTLWCAVVKETGRAALRNIHTHAPDARRATDTIIAGRKDRRLVSIAPVVSNGGKQILHVAGHGGSGDA